MFSFFSLIVLVGSAASQNNHPHLPDEVRFKSGYINPVPKPEAFNSVMLWGIAIADTRTPGFEHAQIEIASTQLSCQVDGKEVILNDDQADVRGGLYIRIPWFDHNRSEPMPVRFEPGAVILPVGERSDRIWHFWAASPRATIPSGKLEGCTAKARVRISAGSLLQMGMDYWRNSAVPFGAGGNNHEAGASNWYFPSGQWQEAVFTDLRDVHSTVK